MQIILNIGFVGDVHLFKYLYLFTILLGNRSSVNTDIILK